jgi:hypothetical protein
MTVKRIRRRKAKPLKQDIVIHGLRKMVEHPIGIE